MNIGRITISYKLLEEAIGLREGNEVVVIPPQSGAEIASRSFSIHVSGPSLPLHHEGTPVAYVYLDHVIEPQA